jgi:nitroreductase
METWDAYRSRRNIRMYTDEPIASEALHRILEAGRRAPSAFNSQPWDFVVVTARDKLIEISKAWQGASQVARSAATIVVVTPIQTDPDKARWSEFDLGQAMMGMAIVATDLGIASAHAIAGDQSLLRAALGVSENYRCAYFLALGHPAEGPLHPVDEMKRRPFAEVAHFERW